VGVLALIAGNASGSIWAHRLHGQYWNGDPKEIISMLMVICYAAYLLVSRRTAWRGARAAMFCMINFVLVLFSFSIVNIYLSHYHKFY
jgi:ABC-type transport system involved in cytochrome c biogenesis permease subunit